MKKNILLIIALLFFQSCIEERIDIKEASKIVHLTKSDLKTFSELRKQLIIDVVKIRKQKDSSTLHQTNRIYINTYYLNKIDSIKYTRFFLKLNGKVGNIMINTSGGINFTLKETNQHRIANYTEKYLHQLVSVDCDCPPDSIFNNVDTVFLDSTINKEWKYTFCKVLTGW